MQRAGRQSLELRYAEERAAPSSLDESFGSVGYASEPEDKRAVSFRRGAADEGHVPPVTERRKRGRNLPASATAGR